MKTLLSFIIGAVIISAFVIFWVYSMAKAEEENEKNAMTDEELLDWECR